MRFISYAELKGTKGIAYSRVHLQRMIKAGQFPASRQLGDGRVAFLESEIDAWIAARPVATGAKEAADARAA